MREPLPLANDQPYDRPHQPWICGRTAEGDPCAFGPERGGKCPHRAECTPVAVNGVWQCNRPAVRGGPCPDGPLADGKCCRHHKCTPVRSLRAVRGKLSKSLLFLGIGLMLMLLGSSSRWQWIAPGPLCESHAQILRRLPSQQRCATCHAVAESEPTSWIAAAFRSREVGPTQSERCMTCHQTSIDPALSLLPHNLPPAQLAAYFNHGQSPANKVPDQIACSVCHQEHHGAHHALAAMDDNRCQACHQQQFRSFAHDHPPLGIWPYERRTPIAFNHASHAGKHFHEKGKSFDCAMCHQSDPTGNVQQTLPYEQSCADCHDGPLSTTLAMGLPLFALPMIDLEALEQVGEHVGAWPESLTGDFDGSLPAPMKMLLARDPDWKAIVATLGADFEMGDIDPDDPEHLRAAAQVVRALKRQWWNVQTSDVDLSSSLGLRRDQLREAQQAWLPELANEMASPSDEAPSNMLPPDNPPSTGSGLVRDDTTMSLVHFASGHSDPLLRSLLDRIAQESDPAAREVALRELASPTSPGLCATCHSIDRADGAPISNPTAVGEGGLKIHWQTADRLAMPRPFTRFSHRPHLAQVELRDCTSCHTIDQGAAAATYSGTNPHAFVSDFQPMSQQACAACHQPHGAADRCTTCHNYHVGNLFPLSELLSPTTTPTDEFPPPKK